MSHSTFLSFRLALLGAVGLGAACGSDDSEEDSAFSTENSGEGSGYLRSGAERLPAACAPRALEIEVPADAPPGDYECTSDLDCTAEGQGVCLNKIDPAGTGCSYEGCVTDADCAADELCECGPGTSYCRKAGCRTSDDCAKGARCIPSLPYRSCFSQSMMTYHCQSTDDTCAADSDCRGGERCTYAEGGRHLCSEDGGGCADVGRPFLVAGERRRASLHRRGDWAITRVGRPEPRSARCEVVSAHWARVAQMEHASVAAFARFTLELMALGAPAELVEAAIAAQADEVAHARLAFGLASEYGAGSVGPSPLPIEGALGSGDLRSVTLNTVLEGCIGETVAALEAQVALKFARPRGVIEVLERIVRDERRHAELAWRFVRWAMERDLALAPEVLAVLEREIARDHGERSCSSPMVYAEFGVLSPGHLDAIRFGALRDVVLPVARALGIRLAA